MVSDLLDFIIHHQYKSCSPNFQKSWKVKVVSHGIRKVWMWISPAPFQVDDEGVLFDKLPRARVRLPLVPQMLRMVATGKDQFCQIFGEFLCVQKSPKNVDEIWFLNHFRNHPNEHLSNFAKICHVCGSFSSIIIVSFLILMFIAHRQGLGLERETVRELSARAGLEFGQAALNIKGFLRWDIGHWYGFFWIAQIYPNIAVARCPERSWMPMRGGEI